MKITKVGAGIVLQYGNRYLVAKMTAKESNPECSNHWVFPGGKFDPELDENIVDTLYRETREETGLKITDPLFIINGRKLPTIQHAPWQVTYFLYRINTQEYVNICAHVEQCEEFDKYLWLKLEDVIKLSELGHPNGTASYHLQAIGNWIYKFKELTQAMFPEPPIRAAKKCNTILDKWLATNKPIAKRI